MTYILDLSHLLEACFLSTNVDDRKYKMCLKIAQDQLEEILGTEYYNQIVSQYPSSFSTDNSALYDPYIKDFLAWGTYLNYIAFANFDPTPTGLREFNDENSSVLTDVKMFAAEKNVQQQVARYRGKMINYLRLEQAKDSTKYPLWVDNCKNEFGFAITSIDKKYDVNIKVNKAVITNE